MYGTLRTALAEVNAAREMYNARCLVVWRELEAIEPELAAEILALGFDGNTAAKWFCNPNRNGEIPAAWVAAGRSAELRAVLERASFGFIG